MVVITKLTAAKEKEEKKKKKSSPTKSKVRSRDDEIAAMRAQLDNLVAIDKEEKRIQKEKEQEQDARSLRKAAKKKMSEKDDQSFIWSKPSYDPNLGTYVVTKIWHRRDNTGGKTGRD